MSTITPGVAYTLTNVAGGKVMDADPLTNRLHGWTNLGLPNQQVDLFHFRRVRSEY